MTLSYIKQNLACTGNINLHTHSSIHKGIHSANCRRKYGNTIIYVDEPNEQTVSKIQVHIFCRYEVINLRKPPTNEQKCDFHSVKVATKVFVHLLTLKFFP